MSDALLSAAPNAAKSTPTPRAWNGTAVRAAEKAGLSYGKYMLQKMQADKKARRCANTDEPKG